MSIILASGSSVRHQLLKQANIIHEVVVPRVDEDAVKNALLAEQATPRDISDALAQFKSRKVSDKYPDALVIGCDQTLDHKGQMFNKPRDTDDALSQLHQMKNSDHTLFSAAVICRGGRPIWRHVGRVRLTMRAASDSYLSGYVDRNWHDIQHAVGAYQLEGEGVRLFSRIEGDYFHVLGLPLLEILAYLTQSGEIET